MKTLRAWLLVFGVLIVIAAPLLVPVFVQAEPGDASTYGPAWSKNSLVPCSGITCDLCDLGELAQRIINYLLAGVVVPLAALLFAYAGVLYFTGGSNSGRVEGAHKIFKNVFVGFLIAISAWLVVNTVLTVVFDKDFFDNRNWYELQCVKEITNRPGQKGRLINTNIGQLFKDFVPEVDAPEYTPPPPPPPDGYDSEGDPVYCPDGYTYNGELGSCFPASGGGGGGGGGGGVISDGGESGDGGGAVGGGVDPDPDIQITPGPIAPGTAIDGRFTYNPKIELQKGDASSALTTMLNCMAGKVPGHVGRISSISDGMIANGTRTWAQCKAGQCQHVANSYHYGGSKCGNKSYAVDFGDEENFLHLKQAADQCGARSAAIHNGNHVHIDVGSCN